jgi:NO-binding membrane sensor protein with MHYT domain
MIVGHYNFALVALSVAIAIVASYTALDLANRVSENSGNPRKAWSWLTAGALAMGAGIWSMHFIGMLAFSLPIPMAYNWPITILSLVIAVVVSALALFILRTPSVALLTLAAGATLMGLGISAMHYTGMMAMQMFPPIHYDALLFITSVLIAILASVAALWIVIALRRNRSDSAILAKLGSAAVMGVAIAGMHYTGMAAAQFAPGSVCLAARSAGLGGSTLAMIVGCIAMAILGLTLILSTLDGHLAKRNALLAQSLQIAKDEAEAALQTNRAITLELQAAQSQLLSAARKAGMAEIASNVLHNVGNVLNSVSVSAGLIGARIRESKVSGVLQSIELMNAHAADIGPFMTGDPKGSRLLPYLNTLAPVITAERAELITESAALLRSVEHIKEIVALQQSYAGGGATVVAEQVDVNALLEDALRINAESMTRQQIAVTRLFPVIPRLLLDKHLVLQILVNLIANANQALQPVTDRPRRLTLRVTLEPGTERARLRISVEDNGEGIAPENLSRLFEHGFTTRETGHGFGLHSGALAARALSGTLTGQNNTAGPGAVFTLELPARPAVAAAA